MEIKTKNSLTTKMQYAFLCFISYLFYYSFYCELAL